MPMQLKIYSKDGWMAYEVCEYIMKHLIDIKNLDSEQILNICSQADIHKTNSKKKNRKILKGKTIANIFFENSTRTLISFELAAKRLGADVINVNVANSSVAKGENLKDTILTLQAMKVDAFIIRHSENKICQQIRQWLKPKVVLINAGDGNNQHPTQALLDVYTILQHKPNIAELKVAIIGDILHSRVANSLIDALHILGNQQIHLFGPPELLPQTAEMAIVCTSMQQALQNSDVIIMLRIQTERMSKQDIPTLESYHKQFGLNRQTLAFARPSCIVMHPGPINRAVEISSEIADNSPSVILKQVKNGILIRQAVLTMLINT
ncbi:Aspartate carbamoyltransferase [hydrothermal vent metagenome]|uniref:aspartate carbamoyltransferase n=1 Tax=hydrothermal vent metagenome TaxID=652676 RepID=A0A3B0WAB6_9ZZZZ